MHSAKKHKKQGVTVIIMCAHCGIVVNTEEWSLVGYGTLYSENIAMFRKNLMLLSSEF